MTQKALILELGLVDYHVTREFQSRLQQQRQEGIWPDLLVLAEHPPTITVGRGGSFDHILASNDDLNRKGVAVHQVERGGDVTYHGPGQLVAYPILDLSLRKKDVHLYVYQLEEVVIRVLSHFDINAHRKAGYPGVWAGSSKIAALGVAVRRWVTTHGLALNVSTDLSYFDLIVPCGLKDTGVTSMAQLNGTKGRNAPAFDEVSQVFKLEFGRVFDYKMLDVDFYKMQVVNNDS